jgi:prepilin-type N-terminal cleavage/methylation domain-containing protein
VGFTLVEVIVVIVIIAILAAIGVPALTGYIDKAQDKKYIVQARDHFVAARTVIDEAYGDGAFEVSKIDYGWQDQFKYFISNGNNYFWQSGGTDGEETKDWELYDYGNYISRDGFLFFDRVSDLLGEEHSSIDPETSLGNPGYWDFHFAGSPGSTSTAFNADGFWYEYFPEGAGNGETMFAVTYKLKSDGLSSNCTYTEYNNAWEYFAYDPNAGYKVYHVVLDWE